MTGEHRSGAYDKDVQAAGADAQNRHTGAEHRNHTAACDEACRERGACSGYCAGDGDGWPKRCGRCGADWTHIGFDYADGFNCRACGGSDADE